jgi:uroporphyrinogen-III decarboxylase
MGAVQEERNQIFRDLYSGKRPTRVPINFGVETQGALEYFGYSPKKDFFSAEKCFEAADKMAELLDVDNLPSIPGSTPGAVFKYIGQKFMQQGADGFFQHPDIAPMDFSEYEEYSKDPFTFFVEKIHPRVFEVFNEEYPELAHLKIRIARQIVSGQFAGMADKLREKHQKESVMLNVNLLWAPFDLIADYVRSFTTILMDMKRAPQKVLDACDATADYHIAQIKASPKPVPGRITTINYPLHMAPYMSTKDVEKFYWPSFRKVIQATIDNGYIPTIFFEADWTNHMHLLADLPTGGPMYVSFEDTKRDLINKYVPKNVIRGRSYPFVLLRTGTKQECVDEAKKVLDLMARDGNFIFSPDKGVIRANDLNIENFKAVIETVKEYGKY